MVHPEYRILRENQDAAINDSLTAIYPATEGVQQGRMRSLTDQALRIMGASPPAELLPAEVTADLACPSWLRRFDTCIGRRRMRMSKRFSKENILARFAWLLKSCSHIS